ncbi:MAG: M1 family metallopeptidase [Pseudomonadota bacterium]
MFKSLSRANARPVLPVCAALVAATFAVLTASASDEPVSDGLASRAPKGRLDDTAKPLHYALAMTVVPNEARFAGEVRIRTQLTRRVEGLYLHGRGLAVSRARAITSDGQEVRANYQQLTDDGVAWVSFGRPVEAGEVTLEFAWDAPFDEQLLGLYRVEEAGRAYAFTQFESIFARRAFVSFDEPRFKTPFDMTLTIDAQHVGIFNTELVSRESSDDGHDTLIFATTERLPTYLVALAVGDLDVVEAPPIAPSVYRKRPLPLRGVAAKGKGTDLLYALRTTGQILAPLEDYFAQPYPYSKLDIIAVPDFQAGAMENAGAVTFRERLLLLKPDAPVTQRQAYASVMAHELAHMWFGNLVTMPWWDDIWLNESFATWMADKALAEFDPDARPDLRRLARLRYAKREDGLFSARQIREPVNDHNDIVSAFDSITYAKGGAVINMIENYIGAPRFRAAMRDHMARFAWGSADADDFIASLVRTSQPVIERSFRSFLFQKGLPQITQAEACKGGRLTLRQQHFVPLGGVADAERRWTFPVCLRFGSSGDDEPQRRCVWLSEQDTSVTFPGRACPDWMMLDADYAGYYHWQGSAEDYLALYGEGDDSDVPLTEVEWQSVSDSLQAGLSAGTMAVSDAWPALARLARRDEPSLSLAPARLLELWFKRYGDEPKLASALRQTAKQLYADKNLAGVFAPGFSDALPSDEARLFHGRLSRFMAMVVQDRALREAALAQVRVADEGDRFDVRRLDALTAQTAMTVAVQDGEAGLRERVLAAFLDSGDSQLRRSALNALGRARDPAFAAALRERAMAGGLRANEIERLLRAQLDEPTIRPDAWRFIRLRYADLIDLMPPRHAARLPGKLAVFCTDDMRGPIESVFTPFVDQVPGGQRDLDKALESLGHCAARSAVERDQVRALFTAGMRR